MRTLAIALALAMLLAPGAAASGPADSQTLACEPQVVAGRLAAIPCSVTGYVGQRFLVRVIGDAANVGPVVVRAAGPYDSEVVFVCPFLAGSAFCTPPAGFGPLYLGTWTFTAIPAVTNVDGPYTYLRMEVTVS